MSIYICLVLVALASVAQNKVSFKTEELKEVANKLKLDSLDTLGVGYSFVAKNKHQLVIRKNGDDMIEHIGIKLFLWGIASKFMWTCLTSWRVVFFAMFII